MCRVLHEAEDARRHVAIVAREVLGNERQAAAAHVGGAEQHAALASAHERLAAVHAVRALQRDGLLGVDGRAAHAHGAVEARLRAAAARRLKSGAAAVDARAHVGRAALAVAVQQVLLHRLALGARREARLVQHDRVHAAPEVVRLGRCDGQDSAVVGIGQLDRIAVCNHRAGEDDDILSNVWVARTPRPIKVESASPLTQGGRLRPGGRPGRADGPVASGVGAVVRRKPVVDAHAAINLVLRIGLVRAPVVVREHGGRKGIGVSSS